MKFARACSRDPLRRFQTADELAQALAGVCGVGRIRMATLDEDQIQYVMRTPGDSDDTSDIDPGNAMSPRTALLAGLIMGVAMMVGVLGFLAWRDHTAEAAHHPAPAVAPPGSGHP